MIIVCIDTQQGIPTLPTKWCLSGALLCGFEQLLPNHLDLLHPKWISTHSVGYQPDCLELLLGVVQRLLEVDQSPLDDLDHLQPGQRR